MEAQYEGLERPARVVIYMTESDAGFLTEIAKRMGFRSRSTMVVAILERLIAGGFSIVTWFRVGNQIMKRLEQTTPQQLEFKFKVPRPLPALPVEDDPTPKETRKALAELREEILTK